MATLERNEYRGLAAVTFVALFVTALVTAQLISSKLIELSLPIIGIVAMPGGTLAYAFTFFATDCMSELYGEDYSRKVVNVAFVMNFVMFTLVLATVALPAAQGSIDPGMFETVLISSGNIVAGSLGAYLISQNFDVFAFHRYRDWTGEKHLWLRNLGSTSISQLLDTVLFTVIAFWLAPMLFGVGQTLPWAVIGSLIVGQYVAKLLLAVVDTPFVYLATGIVKRQRREAQTAAVAD